MQNSYFNLIEQTYYFPQEGFDLRGEYLTFHGISLQYLINKYGTPFRLVYLPKIGDQIKKARNLFNRAINSFNYSGQYQFCYCTKCCHFYHVVSEAVKHDVNLETSSSFDIDLILKLYVKGELNKNRIIVHNGYKSEEYLSKILRLQKLGFSNSIIVLDSESELDTLIKLVGNQKVKIGVRMAVDEEPQSAYYTSRLGLPYRDIMRVYNEKIKPNPNLEMKMLHFFVDSGIKDSIYY